MVKKVILDYAVGDTTQEENALREVDLKLVKAYWTTEEAMVKICIDAEVAALLVGPTAQISQKIINVAPNLKLISRMGVGFNNIDIAAATARNIPVSLVLDYCVTEVADHAMAFILHFARRLLPLDRVVKAGNWSGAKPDIPKARTPMFRLSRLTLGIIGSGRIGGALVHRARSFGMKVIAYDPYLSAEVAQKLGVELVELNTLLNTSDFISLHAPLTKETRHLLNMDAFKKMKPTSYLINNARGGLVDEQALYLALKEGYIAGAGLDVTDPEPVLADNPLLKLENVLITGHSSWYSEDSAAELRWKSVMAVVDFFKGIWPVSLANPDVKRI
jgi:D-3-phosphoglycerate dehydrogenase / 2-oxoglutarate reductase